MEARPGVIDRLNSVLTNDLTATNQYFLQAEMCRHWGFEGLYHELRERSMREMKDVELLMGHILALEGVPNLQRLGRVQIGENAREHLELDLEAERNAIRTLTEAVKHCAEAEDYATRRMLEKLLEDENQDLGWVETQLATIKQVGLENYLTEKIKKG